MEEIVEKKNRNYQINYCFHPCVCSRGISRLCVINEQKNM